MLKKRQRVDGRSRRRRRIRKKISGSDQRPRLSVFRSNRHIYGQIVDDLNGVTIAAASSLDADMQENLEGKDKMDRAKEIGRVLGARAKEKGVERVVFDRNGYLYHGRVAAVADGAREAGLNF
jgi:large subunit ribosomal protein L18